MQIAICDDIHKDLETIRTALDSYAKAHQISIPRRGSEEAQKIYMDFCRKEAFK